MKDDSGSYAVFSEQGSSASHRTGAKVLDVTSRLPGCTGQASDAVSDCTQVKMEDAPKFLGFTRIRVPNKSGLVYHEPAAQNHGTKIKTCGTPVCTDIH